MRMLKLKKVKVVKSLVLFLLLLFASCSGETPELYESVSHIVLFENKNRGIIYEELSIFVHVQDLDGLDDIIYFYLINDDEELIWEMDAENWVLHNIETETWIGSNGVKMGDYSTIPRGLYRLLIVDSAGERAESEIYLNAEKLNASIIEFPSVNIDANIGTIEVNSRFERTILWIYSSTDEIVKSFAVSEKKISLDSIFESESEKETASYLYIYSYDNNNGYGLKSGPYLF